MGIGGATRLIDGRLMGRCQYGDRLAIQERAMHTTTQKLMLQGGLILLGALVVSSIGGCGWRGPAADPPAALVAPGGVGGVRSPGAGARRTPEGRWAAPSR